MDRKYQRQRGPHPRDEQVMVHQDIGVEASDRCGDAQCWQNEERT